MGNQNYIQRKGCLLLVKATASHNRLAVSLQLKISIGVVKTEGDQKKHKTTVCASASDSRHGYRQIASLPTFLFA